MSYEPLFNRKTVKKIYPLCCRLSEKERKKCDKALPSEIRVNELKEEDIFQPVELAAPLNTILTWNNPNTKDVRFLKDMER